jgi:hypothetical protein
MSMPRYFHRRRRVTTIGECPERDEARASYHSTQIGLAISDISVEPVAERMHVAHDLAHLVNGRQLREAVLLNQVFSDGMMEYPAQRLTRRAFIIALSCGISTASYRWHQ